MADDASAPKINIIAKHAISAEPVAEVRLHPTDTLLDLRQAILHATGEKKPIRLVFEGRKLLGMGTLEHNGLTDGCEVDMFKGGLPGWTRICHGDRNAQETTGSSLVWDFPMEEIKCLAVRASRVRIQQRGDPEIAVESKAGTYPIDHIREGLPISFGRSISLAWIGDIWELPQEAEEFHLLEKLWHNDCRWTDKVVDDLELAVYVCSDNAAGIHWDNEVCGWTSSDSTDLELYIDVE
eukprot:TRINITY_DN36895_c0_g1_i1.p1 TRINITY_DN36895_c0_g1~~TRINITY_DN36895_c0_g1_i1.p1  ORF type:complete len:238 (-),score=36.74 TRINITY_DN36895_c0_g1_i1:23-736(-)